MYIHFGDDLIWVFHMSHMFVMSCLVVELMTEFAAHFAELLDPHLKNVK